MAKFRPIKFMADKKKNEFLNNIVIYGTIEKAAEMTGIARQTHYDWRKNNDEYCMRFDEAMGMRCDNLEDAAYKRAVENLLLELVKLGQLHCVRLKQLSVQREGKKLTVAVYAYQVDNGGAWGEIQFDLEKGTAWVEAFAENDPCDTWEITDAAIRVILSSKVGKIPKRILIPCKVKNHIM